MSRTPSPWLEMARALRPGDSVTAGKAASKCWYQEQRRFPVEYQVRRSGPGAWTVTRIAPRRTPQERAATCS